MMSSRWLRRRYYPLYLEELYRPLSLPLAFINISDLTRGLKAFSDVIFLSEWSLHPKEIIAYTVLAPLDLSYSSMVCSLSRNAVRLYSISRRDFISSYPKVLALGKEVWEQPFLALLHSSFQFDEIEHSEFAFKFLSDFIVREATPVVHEGLLLYHSCQVFSKINSDYTAFFLIPFHQILGFGFPLRLFTSGSLISRMAALSSVDLQESISPISSQRITTNLFSTYRFALRSSKYFREDEDEITPFLQPFKLNTLFIYPLDLHVLPRNINNYFTLRTKLIGFKILEKLRTPDIISITLSLGASYISVPEIVTLRILPEFDYDLQTALKIDRNLNLLLLGRLEKSYLALLKLIIEDAGGEFLFDIEKSIFDIIEVYILQPGVLKFSL